MQKMISIILICKRNSDRDMHIKAIARELWSSRASIKPGESHSQGLRPSRDQMLSMSWHSCCECTSVNLSLRAVDMLPVSFERFPLQHLRRFAQTYQNLSGVICIKEYSPTNTHTHTKWEFVDKLSRLLGFWKNKSSTCCAWFLKTWLQEIRLPGPIVVTHSCHFSPSESYNFVTCCLLLE